MHAHIYPLLDSQGLLDLVDGSSTPPPQTVVTTNGSSSTNVDYIKWKSRDQLMHVFLLSTLTEETLSQVVSCSTSCDVWTALSHAYSHSSKARELSIKDELLNAKCGDSYVAEFGRLFKGLCDQLSAIGRPIDEVDKAHWFLRGLISSFSNFIAAQWAIEPLPSFFELLSRATSHELFQKGLDAPTPAPDAFFAAHKGRGRSNFSCGHGNSSPRGRGQQQSRGRRNWVPYCFFFCQEDHNVFDCPKCFDRSFDRNSRNNSTHLAGAFSANCNISHTNHSDWFVDTCASAHMTSDASQLETSSSYSGPENVVIGNGAPLHISRTDMLSLSSDL